MGHVIQPLKASLPMKSVDKINVYPERNFEWVCLFTFINYEISSYPIILKISPSISEDHLKSKVSLSLRNYLLIQWVKISRYFHDYHFSNLFYYIIGDM